MAKIGIIGLGHVGAHVASAIIAKSLAEELYLFDLNKEKAFAEKKDLEQASVLEDVCPKVFVAELDDLLACDIVVNTASGKIANQDRLLELAETRKIIEVVFKNFNKETFKGIIINVSNPCDVVSALIKRITGLDKSKVIGTGTLLDTVRFKQALSEKYNVNPKDVQALVIGEHGNSQVNVYSNTYIQMKKIQEYNKEELDNEVKLAGWNIFKVKGTTEYGIGNVTAYLIKQILTNSKKALPFSHYYIYNGQEIYTSTVALIGRDGYLGDVETELSFEEIKRFNSSCEVLAKVLS